MNNDKIKVELNVDIHCNSCVDTISKGIKDNLKQTEIVQVDLHEQRLVLESSDLTIDICDVINSTGKTATICGVGSGKGSAVCSIGEIEGWEKGCGGAGGEGVKGVYGVVRILQTSASQILFEGIFKGLNDQEQTKKPTLVVHEFGNLLNGCQSVGKPYKNTQQQQPVIGTSTVSEHGQSQFRVMTKDRYEFWDLIGRSIVLHSSDDIDSPNDKRIACGIICRAASVGQNQKKICPCDGPPPPSSL
ncbi:copper chaperone for superoxide dismutase [Tieghemostelium lacteum]|uniref:Superoxide dismutase copper chaperone n=1 Tax=Tieghemostelium lacteum TaxID=361077 RepID=A0A151Z717_TIELA|nr:copper chaperone for superoxide dismutase [Tieghemostelium lacteum]|eukprot:KYQ89753.1 copper chaperone for superoxide dismutase [Tieghemostelium lacteum]